MSEKLKKLNALGKGAFICINDTTYQNEKYNAMVYTRKEFTQIIKTRLLEEIPYTSNEILKRHLPEKFQSELILNEYKELSKFDHTLLSNSIIDEDLFLFEMVDEVEDLCDLVLSDSVLNIKNGYNILTSQIEN